MENFSEPMMQDEKTLWAGKPRFWVYFAEDGMIISIIGFLWLFSSLAFYIFNSSLALEKSALFFSLYALFGLILLIAPALWVWAELQHLEYTITTRRIIVKSGIVKPKTETIDRNNILRVEQIDDAVDRTLGHHSASIKIYRSQQEGEQKQFLTLAHIAAPHEVIEILMPASTGRVSAQN